MCRSLASSWLVSLPAVLFEHEVANPQCIPRRRHCQRLAILSPASCQTKGLSSIGSCRGDCRAGWASTLGSHLHDSHKNFAELEQVLAQPIHCYFPFAAVIVPSCPCLNAEGERLLRERSTQFLGALIVYCGRSNLNMYPA